MRVSKLLPAICAVTVCAGLVSVRADDNPAQAAARAALMEKMAAPDAQQEQTNNPAPPPAAATEPQNPPATIPAPPVETPPATAAPVEPQPPAAAPAMAAMPDNSNFTAPATTSSDNEAQAAARAALMEKMNQETQTGQAPPVLTNSSDVVPEPAAQPVPMISQPPTNSIVAPVSSSQTAVTNQQAEKAREKAEAAARAQAKAQAKQAAKVKKEAAKAAKQNQAMTPPPANNSGANVGLQPIEAPALPISSAKQMQLQALDAKYKADQISPQDYFKQREAILSGP